MANNYDLPVPDVIKRNPAELKKLREAFGYFYDENSKVNVIYRSPPDPRFQTVTQFVDYLYSNTIGIPKGTSAKEMGIILERWYENLSKTPEYAEPTVTENVPDAERRKLQEEERQKREASAKLAAENAKKDVERAIQRQQELHEQLKTRKIYRRAIEPQATPLEVDKTGSYQTLSDQANANPEQFTKELSDEIAKRLSLRAPEGQDEEIEYLSKEAALGVTQKLRGNSPAVETATLYQLSQQKALFDDIGTEESSDLSRTLDNVMGLEIAKYNEQRRTIEAAFGNNFADNFFGPKDLNGVQIDFSNKEAPGYGEYGLNSITQKNLDFLGRQDDLFGHVQSYGTLDFKSYFLKETGKFIESQIPKNALLAKAFESTAIRSAFNIYVMGEPLVYTNLIGRIALETGHGPFLAWLGEVSGIDFGIMAASSYVGGTVISPYIYASAATYAEATTTLALTGGTFASEAFAGGAAVSLDFATTTGFAGYSTATSTFAAGTVSTIAGAGTAGVGAATTTAVSTAAGTTVAGATGAAVGAAGAAGGATAGAAAGTALGPIGTAIGAVIGLVVGALVPKIKEIISKSGNTVKTLIGGGLGASIAYFAGFGIIPGAIIGGLGTLGVSSFASGGLGGVQSTLSGIAGATVFGARVVMASFLQGVGGPLIAILLGFPILVAFILLVINSGAYVVPPSLSPTEGSGVITSPYIDVQKTANPPGPFENSEIPLFVEYTVTIGAKKGALTNVSIEYKCNVIHEGAPPPCPDPDPAIPTAPAEISPSTPFTFTYKHLYGEKFMDSLVTDVITVTADASEQKGAKAAAAASVRIGQPPDDCPSIWPTSYGEITAGPRTASDHHKVLEAIDIAVGSGTPVFATHTGVVVYAQSTSCYGNFIKLQSSCNGRDFISRYAHLEGINVSVGQTVTMGETIGISDNTTGGSKCSSGPHLHYDFTNWPSETSTQPPDNPPFMQIPYVPVNIPKGCDSRAQCNNIRW